MAWVVPRTWVAGETLTAALMNEQVRDNWNAAFPVGSLHWRMQAATSVETSVDGFGLETNGVNVLRATFAALQTKLSGLSYPFGSGNGTTTMGIPDLSGRSPVAHAASGHGDVDALGDSDGLTKASRTPKVAAHTHTGPSHTHTMSGSTGAESVSGVAVGAGGIGAAATPHTHGAGTLATGAAGTGATGSGGAVPGNFLVPGIIIVKY